MKPFINIISNAIIVETENVDTDQIIPAIFLKTTKKTGLGKFLFYNWRYNEKGKLKKSIFNNDKSKEAEILIAGKNFGSGSSREHAVWSLMDYGFKTIISSGFGDIFYNNALKNGLLCIKLADGEIKKLSGIKKKNSNIYLEIDLEEQVIEVKNKKLVFNFEIDPFRKSCLLLGVDELGYILSHEEKISAYEKSI